jgi:predicted DsbA family dithiol-disulfide isomerase
VFKNMVVHPQVVTDAHHAGCAAAKQGKFVEFKNAFWDKAFQPYAAAHDPSKLGLDNIMAIAKDIGLDTTRLKSDMDSADCKQQIESDMAELAKFHTNSTPTFFVNGKHINGALPKDAFKQVIEERLKVAAASGVPGASYYDQEIMGKGDKQFRSSADDK